MRIYPVAAQATKDGCLRADAKTSLVPQIWGLLPPIFPVLGMSGPTSEATV
ncbi:MAG: hypothetical protein AAF827_03285 [Cyanobacteria bacterium P01_D01_bin.6]